MSRLIDADALERDGWQMSRTVRVDKYTMEIQTRKPTDFPTIEPQRMRGKWIDQKGGGCCCSECGRYALDEPDGNFIHVAVKSNYCPNCGCQMNGDEEDEQ